MLIVLDHRSALGQLKRSPAGGARVPATLMRPGLSTYYGKDGKKIVHYTPREVVADALDSARDAPVTFNHPPEREVTPANHDRVAKGHVRSDSLRINDQGVLEGELVINSAELLDAIETGVAREVSPGYSVEYVEEPGVVDGEPYDVRRTKIVFNHKAVLKAGRQGRTVRLLLDSAESTIAEETETMKIIIDGQEVSPEAVQGRIDGLVESNKGLKSQVETLTAQLADAKDETKLEALVKTRAEKLVADQAEAKRVQDEKDAAEAKHKENLAKAKTAFPKLVVDGKEYAADYIQALVDTIANDTDGVTTMAGGTSGTSAAKPDDKKTPPVTTNDADEAVDAREYQRRSNAAIWTQPIPGAVVAGAK